MTQDEFVNLAADHVQAHFPKGKTTMRGEAMVLVAMICKDLLEAGVLVTDLQPSDSDTTPESSKAQSNQKGTHQ